MRKQQTLVPTIKERKKERKLAVVIRFWSYNSTEISLVHTSIMKQIIENIGISEDVSS